jgi:hypothetical protein
MGQMIVTRQYRQPINLTGTGAYTGPGDVSGWTANQYAYWGLRAVKASYIGSACIDITDQADANPLTVNIAANGYVDTAAINAWVTAHSVSTIRVTKIYEQVGGANHMLASASKPHLVMNVLAGLPVFDFDGSSMWFTSTNNVAAQAQPLTFTAIGQQSAGAYISEGNFDVQPLISLGAGGIAQQTSGSAITYSGNTYSVFHAYISELTGTNTTCTMQIDGTLQTNSNGSGPGTAGFLGGAEMTIGADTPTGGVPLAGQVFEAFVLTSAPNSTQQTALNTNMHGIGTGW